MIIYDICVALPNIEQKTIHNTVEPRLSRRIQTKPGLDYWRFFINFYSNDQDIFLSTTFIYCTLNDKNNTEISYCIL